MRFGSDCWLPALSMSILCIDAAYQDSRGIWQNPETQERGYTEKMLRWLFDGVDIRVSQKILNETIQLLAKGLANGLKHDTFVRKPITLFNPYLRHTFNEPPNFAVHLGGDEAKTILTVRVDLHGDERVMVFPTLWWETVRNRIDQHYKLCL